MTQCNCKNTDELRIVRGNAFAIRLTVSAVHIDGTPVENFVLGEAEAVLKVMHLDEKTQKDFLIVGNDAIISFDGTQPLGWYGFEMTGTFNGKPWRWCVPQVFQVVETNAKANIPAWAMLTDETYSINGVMTITSGDIYQSDWDETDPQSPSYIKNKPTALADFSQDETHRVVTDGQIAAWNAKYDKPSGGIPKSDLAQSVQDSLDDADTAYQKPAGGIPATDLAGDIPESKLDQATQDKIDAGDSAYQLPSGGIPKSDLAQSVQDSLDDADTAYQKPSGGIPATDLAGDIPESKLDQSTQDKIDAGDSAYQLPSGGIPKTDLDSSVQTSLGKADTAIQDVTQIETDIDNIEKLIPEQATEQNQLADKEFVNSSISTATATYRGAYNLVSDLSLTTSATEQQIAAALATKMAALSIEPDNNDYCFVQIPTADATPTQIARVDRYKYNGTDWAFEYSLNNSGFTAAQWAALNSGITSGLVTKLSDLPTNSDLTTLLNGKQDTISDLSDIRSGAAAGATAYQKPSGGIPSSDMSQAVQTSLGKADEAAPQATTYTKTEVDNKIGDLGNTAPVYYTQAEADAYNAELDGALNSTDALTAEQASAYNAAITGASKEAGDTLSEAEANAYNATLEGAVSTSDVKIPAAPKSVKQYVDDGLSSKQDTLTFDNTPTENSNNPVKSGGIYDSQAVQDARIAALEKLHEDGADYIYIDETIEDPMTRVYGDVNGPVIQWIRKNSHRYLGKRTADGVMTVCQLDDANSNLYAEDGSAAVLTGAEGDVFMWLPEFYTETVEIGTKLWRIGFSKKSLGTGWHKWKNDNLVGIYEASTAQDKAGNTGTSNDGNGILRSVSGTASVASISQANFKTKARNKGTGYSLVLWRQHCIMAVLYYAEYGNTNCQGSIGSGTNNRTKVPGQTDALGMTDTVNGGNGSSGSINFWGLENWWGNKAEWIDNVEVNPLDANDEPMIGVWRITEDDGTTTDIQGSTDPLDTNIYAQNLVYGDNLHIIARGNQVAGTSSTNYCDAIYTGSDGSRVVYRSNYVSIANGGVACARAFYVSSYSYANLGSRLAFRGQIVKAESVAAFKAAPDYVGTIDAPAEENNE